MGEESKVFIGFSSHQNKILSIQISGEVAPCRLVNSYRRSVHFQGQAIPDSLTLKQKARRSYETSVTIYQSAQRNNPEDLNLQQHCCEKLKFRKMKCYRNKLPRKVNLSKKIQNALCVSSRSVALNCLREILHRELCQI